MSLIPFILDLADELHEFSRCLANGIDINDFGFGLYTGSEQQTHSQPPSASTSPQQQQQQSPRRSRTSSFSSFWLPSKRHHPYNRIKSACCGKNAGEEGGATNSNVATASPEKDATIVPTPNKTASYSVVNKNGFQVSMNVKQFAPNELSVKTIDNCIVVEGRHDDKEDGHGVISRHFVRKYMLPKGYDPKDVMSTLSSDGILTVKAPPPPPPSAKVDEPNERIVAIQPTPGPTQMVPTPMSAAAAQPKEQTKKLLSPAAREECQLPEKRQKLDVAQQQQEEDEKQATLKQQQAPTQTIPATITTTTQSTSTPPQSPTPEQPDAGAGALNDNENDGEQTAEIDDKQQQKGGEDVDEGGQQQQQQQPPTAAEDITDIETNNAVAAITAEEDKTENQLETKESAMEIDETEEENNKTAKAQQQQQQEKQKTEEEQKDVVEEKLPETNGSDNIIGEIAEATEPAAESCNTTTTTNSSAEKINDEVPAEAVSEADGKSTAMEVDGDDDVADQTKTTADEDATVTGASEDKLKEVVTDEEKNVDGKCPETAENSNSTPTNSDKEEQDNKTNSKSTGENPADASESPVAAESANDKVTDTETAVDTTTTTTANTTIATDIDVALLKKAAATADAAEITAAAENALLSEPMDGIATTDSAVDTVECSLFAKTLGNGNSNSAATALVAKEEVAN